MSHPTPAGRRGKAAKPAKPLDNADLGHFWRKRMVRVVVEQALQRIRDQESGLDR